VLAEVLTNFLIRGEKHSFLEEMSPQKAAARVTSGFPPAE